MRKLLLAPLLLVALLLSTAAPAAAITGASRTATVTRTAPCCWCPG